MFKEAELLPLSALQHIMFCERQCALIHVEQQWRENSLTLEGSRLHSRADESAPRCEKRGDIVILRGLALRSFDLGLSGRSDVVELRRQSGDISGNVDLPGFEGSWAICPVEYKRGKPKKDKCDDVQLCAQAMCLEEMLGIHVEKGSLFYGARKRRHEVEIDNALREMTRSAARRLRDIVDSRSTPLAVEGPKCASCSLREICMPSVTGNRRSARRYTQAHISMIEGDWKAE